MYPRIKQIAPFGDGSVSQKVTPVGADRIALDDSAASFARVWATITSLKPALLGNAGISLPFGSDMKAADVGLFFEPHGLASGNQYSPPLNSESQLVCPISGTIEALAWISENAVTAALILFWLNGLATATTASLTGSSGVVTGIGLSISAGTRLALEYDAQGTGSELGLTCIDLFVRGV